MPTDHYHLIRRRFIFSVAGIMAILVVLFCWNSVREYRFVITAAENRSVSHARVLKEHAERAISEADSALLDVLEHLEEHASVAGLSGKYLEKMLSAHIHNSPQISSLFMIDRNGRLLAHSGKGSFNKTIDLSDQDFFTRHRDLKADNSLYISRSVISPMTGKWQFTISRPIRSVTEGLAAIVVASFDVDYFTEFYSGMDPGSQSRILLVRSDGQLILAVPFAESIFRQDFRKSKLFREPLPRAAYGTYRIDPGMALLGEPGRRIVSYRTLNGYPIVALANISQDDAIVLWRSAFIKQSIIAVLLALLALTLSILFLRQLKSIKAANMSLISHQQELRVKAELLDSASDAMLLLDEYGGLVQFNNALCIITGFSRLELETMRVQDLMPPGYAEKVEENIRLIFENGAAVTESVYRHASGKFIPVEGHSRAIKIGQQVRVLSIVRDISYRKEADDKILAAVKEWQNTFDAVGDVVWLLDMDRRIIRANRATQDVFDKTHLNALGLTCCEAAHEDLKQHPDCPFDVMIKSKKRASMQMPIENRWFEVSVDPVFSDDGAIINAVHIVKDITDLKTAELREHVRSEILERIARGEPLKQLLSIIAVSIEKELPGSLCSILLADEDGKRLLNGAAPSLPEFYNIAVNRTRIGEGVGSCGTAAFRQTRVVVEDIATHPFWIGFKAAEEAGLRSCWSEPIFSSSGLLLGTFAIYHRQPAAPGDDEIRLIEQASAFAGIAIERSKNEVARDELENRLSQSQKMEAVGHLAGGVAHDFNNLLTPIIVYADMLKRSLAEDEKLLPRIEGIIKAAHKARDLTQQLLSFGRKQVMQMQTLDLNEVITSFYSIMRRSLRESIDINLQLSSQAAIIRADRSKLDQVILNLAINAQDAISETGHITIETGQVMIDDEYARLHPGMKTGDFVLLSFMDSGCGMTGETMRHIFEPFFTTKQVGHGTGLGLANIYGIVKQHNGYIAVQSKPGAGAAFKIYFPLTDEKPDGIVEFQEERAADYTGAETILLVEDNEMVRVMTADLLEGIGYRVYVEGHPDQALELVRQIPEKIDLLITDVVMPGMNGQQLFERINIERPDIDRVLYMSGYTNNVIVTDGALEEGIHFLQKPFTIDALLSKIRGLLHPAG